jgi:multidrug efflux pump subunit AcrB
MPTWPLTATLLAALALLLVACERDAATEVTPAPRPVRTATIEKREQLTPFTFPVGFSASAASEYTFSLFVVVAIALLASWFVAVIFAPLLGVVILVPPRQKGQAASGFVFRQYRRLLVWTIRARWLTLGGTAALFAASALALPLIPQQFFPSSDRPELLVDISLPQNASIFASQTAARRLDQVLTGDPDVGHWST